MDIMIVIIAIVLSIIAGFGLWAFNVKQKREFEKKIESDPKLKEKYEEYKKSCNNFT